MPTSSIENRSNPVSLQEVYSKKYQSFCYL
nr:MAG TPA: hypothetical protein [Caudoviricetes sp.]